MREGTRQVSESGTYNVFREGVRYRDCLTDWLSCKEALTVTCCAHFVTNISSSVVFCYHIARKQLFQGDARV